MIEQVWMVVGLPGSGKSAFSKQLAEALDFAWLDDPGTRLTQEQLQDELQELSSGHARGLIVSDPTLCYEENRRAAVELVQQVLGSPQLVWVYFENDPAQCLANSRARALEHPHLKVERFIEEASKVYRPPATGAVPVYRPRDAVSSLKRPMACA